MISKVIEFYSISLTVYKTVVITVYVPGDLTLNDDHFTGAPCIRGATQNFREYARNNMNIYFKS
jgi:hypothetical protein